MQTEAIYVTNNYKHNSRSLDCSEPVNHDKIQDSKATAASFKKKLFPGTVYVNQG